MSTDKGQANVHKSFCRDYRGDYEGPYLTFILHDGEKNLSGCFQALWDPPSIPTILESIFGITRHVPLFCQTPMSLPCIFGSRAKALNPEP